MSVLLYRWCVLVAAGLAAAAAGSAPAANGEDAHARYERERARCLSGASHQDVHVCLKEAAAALQAARRNDLDTQSPAQLAENARRRCDVFKNAEDKKACLARVDGEGTTAGSVAAGGILREYREVIPGAPASAPQAAPAP